MYISNNHITTLDICLKIYMILAAVDNKFNREMEEIIIMAVSMIQNDVDRLLGKKLLGCAENSK